MEENRQLTPEQIERARKLFEAGINPKSLKKAPDKEAYWLEARRRWKIRKEARKKKDNRLCKCGYDVKQPAHSCPFAEEMNNDYGKHCTCCSSCTRNCAMDV